MRSELDIRAALWEKSVLIHLPVYVCLLAVASSLSLCIIKKTFL